MTMRVLVAMSGGVDSSVAAALLKDQGFDVAGVTMKLAAGVCCDIASAMAVCEHLGIPHMILDMQDAFAREIMDNFVSEYSIGRTPNPCIRCNDLVKFRRLLDYAVEHGFDKLATGHYARIVWDDETGRFLLKKGVDEAKDQSYFLYRMTQDQMKHVLFPLGGYKKADVRRLAGGLNLPTAERPESQEVCFIPGNDYRAFLKEHAPEALRPGEMVMTDGTVVGRHEGVAFFTIGQRRKLRVSMGSRLYVVRIEAETNRVVLGRYDDLLTSEAFAAHACFISFDELKERMHVTAKIRYRSPFVPAVIEPAVKKRVRIVFDHPVPGVCPGQAAVFYHGDVVVGGGIIDQPFETPPRFNASSPINS